MEAGRIRALIIEDNQDITANLYAFLEPLGYELDCSANGHIGLEMAVAGTFDVIVLDIMLPGMGTGWRCAGLYGKNMSIRRRFSC